MTSSRSKLRLYSEEMAIWSRALERFVYTTGLTGEIPLTIWRGAHCN